MSKPAAQLTFKCAHTSTSRARASPTPDAVESTCNTTHVDVSNAPNGARASSIWFEMSVLAHCTYQSIDASPSRCTPQDDAETFTILVSTSSSVHVLCFAPARVNSASSARMLIHGASCARVRRRHRDRSRVNAACERSREIMYTIYARITAIGAELAAPRRHSPKSPRWAPETLRRTLSRPRARARVARETLVLRARATPCTRENARKHKSKTARMCITLFKTARHMSPPRVPRKRLAPWSRSVLEKSSATHERGRDGVGEASASNHQSPGAPDDDDGRLTTDDRGRPRTTEDDGCVARWDSETHDRGEGGAGHRERGAGRCVGDGDADVAWVLARAWGLTSVCSMRFSGRENGAIATGC